ncbi:hypothetical protein BSKO_01605 [Bryopsis sp. KO-2023]|nr:hypothetical protein BSKO_01605 [Bryopsis sp. KO-2023]
MGENKVGSRDEYNAAREELLKAEKELTKRRDEVTKLRQKLPWVKVEKDYTLQGSDGPVKLSELFVDGKKDLIVVHFMFDPEWDKPCSHCCCWAEDYNGLLPFLEDKTNFAVVAKAPIDRLKDVKDLKGWKIPFLSADGSDFNKDFKVEDTIGKAMGKEFPLTQGPGLSVFRKQDGGVFHTYSTFHRGLEHFNAIWTFMDMLPDGREGWSPKHKEEYSKKRKMNDGQNGSAKEAKKE